MYGYGEIVTIEPEQLYSKIKQESIFEAVLKEEINLESKYKSPLRQDDNPGCRFEVREDGILLFVDFGERMLTGHTHRTAIMMVMDYFGVSYHGAVGIICAKFGLSTNPHDYAPILANHQGTLTDSRKVKSEAIITYTKRPLGKSDLIFWSQSFITAENLTQDQVFPISDFTIDNHKGKRKIKLYGLAYAIDFVDKVKIYQPNSKEYKFITNCDEDNIGNFDNLPATGEEIVIQKSYRDHRVIRNLLGLPTVWFMNEGCIPSYEILVNIVKRFKLITIFYDRDQAGVLAAIKLFNVFNAIREGCVRMIHLPTSVDKFVRSYKDPAECAYREGRRDTIIILNSIGLYGSENSGNHS